MPTPFDITAFDCIFRDISPSIHIGTHARDVALLVIERVVKLLEAKGAIIRTLNIGSSQTDIAVSCGLSEKYLNKGPVAWETIIRGFQEAEDVCFVMDVRTDPRVQYPEEAWEEGIRMIVDVPLHLGDRIVGVMRVYFPDQRELSKEEINFLIFTSHQGACAIEKAGLIETQQAQYDHLAIQTEKLSALGRLAAGIAHEINNPLAGILLYSSNMVKKVPDKGPLREGLEVIIHETRRCKSIIQDLLEFSRESEPKTAPANINGIVEKALSLLANEFLIHHIQVEKRLAKEMKEVMLDEKQIEQVLVNLLINAVQAIGEEGVITVKSEVNTRKGCVEVVVADTGCGIREEHVSRIFEPFFSTKKKGTGLGLSVSYGIVQKHHGRIQVSSRVGEGARFTLEFPLPFNHLAK